MKYTTAMLITNPSATGTMPPNWARASVLNSPRELATEAARVASIGKQKRNL